MYKEISVNANIPEAKLRRAAKSGVFTLTKSDLSGSGASLALHPESYAKVMKAENAGRGARVAITPHEIEWAMTTKQGSGMHGGSIWGKIWSGIKFLWPTVLKPALSA